MLFAVFLFNGSLANGAENRDGNWWNAQSRSSQYLAGFLDGVVATNGNTKLLLSPWFTPAPKCDTEACYAKMSEYARNLGALITKDERRYDGVTVGQIADGLSRLFSDYRNRQIGVIDVEEVVKDSIRGSTDDQIQRRLELLRKNASR